MKCQYSINYYGERDQEVNKGIKISECLRYSKDKTWEYVIQYRATIEFRAKFIFDIHNELKRVQLELISNEELRMVINDIRKYLSQNEEEFEMNQGSNRMKYLL